VEECRRKDFEIERLKREKTKRRAKTVVNPGYALSGAFEKNHSTYVVVTSDDGKSTILRWGEALAIGNKVFVPVRFDARTMTAEYVSTDGTVKVILARGKVGSEKEVELAGATDATGKGKAPESSSRKNGGLRRNGNATQGANSTKR